MKRRALILAAVAGLALASGGALVVLPDALAGTGEPPARAAAERTVTFAVDKMTCAACPITVRKAMEQVAGVRSVAVDFAAKTATVVFDPAVATPEQIGAASTNAGYPAAPASQP